MHKIGDRLRALREKNSMSQKQLGDAIGLAYSSISAIESNRSSPLETLRKISEYFKVDPNWLINGEGEAPKGVVITTGKAAQLEGSASVDFLLQENQRLWRLIEKLMKVEPGTIANFLDASTATGATVIRMAGAQVGAQAA